MVYTFQLVNEIISKFCLCPLLSSQSKGNFSIRPINGEKSQSLTIHNIYLKKKNTSLLDPKPGQSSIKKKKKKPGQPIVLPSC